MSAILMVLSAISRYFDFNKFIEIKIHVGSWMMDDDVSFLEGDYRIV